MEWRGSWVSSKPPTSAWRKREPRNPGEYKQAQWKSPHRHAEKRPSVRLQVRCYQQQKGRESNGKQRWRVRATHTSIPAYYSASCRDPPTPNLPTTPHCQHNTVSRSPRSARGEAHARTHIGPVGVHHAVQQSSATKHLLLASTTWRGQSSRL
jgi:hypothetical protein